MPVISPEVLKVAQDGPVKKIASEADIDAWVSSQAFDRLTHFISLLVNAVTGHSLAESVPSNSLLDRLVAILDTLDAWIDQIPLRTDPQRFGNLAFRDWGAKLEEHAEALHSDLVPSSSIGIQAELVHHFKTSFGSFTRIDYGSGHELSFLAYLSLFYLGGVLEQGSERALVWHVFVRYLQLCHRLQTTYRLEPAGSKGVWGLDDYKFTPFILGAAQLLPPCPSPPPVKSILNIQDQSDKLAMDNLFFMSVAQIHAIKRGPFHEHSPVLFNIATTVPNWGKVCSGLQKMYLKEVLEKWPVVQHFYFGACLPWKSQKTGQELPTTVSPSAGSESPAVASSDAFTTTHAPWATTTTSRQPSSLPHKTLVPDAATARIPGLESGDLGRL